MWLEKALLIRSRLRLISFILRLSYKETIETLKYWVMLVTGEERGGGKGRNMDIVDKGMIMESYLGWGSQGC